MDTYIENQPNAAKLLQSLRQTGYDSYTAIEDIIDNSIDANAKVIKVYVNNQNKDLNIIIADDGIGMNSDILDEALKLGSNTEKDTSSDLGRFGMGLCTASISMAKKLEVITREDQGEYYYSSQDLDEVIKENRFVKEQRFASDSEKHFFNDIVSGGSGSIIILSKIDLLSDRNITQFANKLSRDIGRIYRKFIESGITFYVNDKKIGKEDPLMLDNEGTQVYSDEIYELPIMNGKKEKISVKIVILPDVNNELESAMKMNIRTQGFYILRNNREIAMGKHLDIFSKHNDFNRLRMELSFNASLDPEMGVRFSKDGIAPNQIITDFLKQELHGQIASIRKIFTKKKKADEGSSVNHSESEEVISRKAKLLIAPDAVVEKRAPRVNRGEEGVESGGSEKTRVGIKDMKVISKGLSVRFETLSMGREGSLYDCYQEGKIIIIQWNIDHPFYDKIIFPNKESKEIISGLDYLVFALASAELKVSNDENLETLSNIKTIMSANLRALLS